MPRRKGLRAKETVQALSEIPDDASDIDEPDNAVSDDAVDSDEDFSSYSSESETSEHITESENDELSSPQETQGGSESPHDQPAPVRGGRQRGRRGRRGRGTSRGSGRGVPAQADLSPDVSSEAPAATRPPRRVNQPSVADVFKPGRKLLGKDGTEWTVEDPKSRNAGRLQQQNVFKDKPGPSPHARRYIEDGDYTSAWKLLFDDRMLKHIQKCTIEEAKRQLGCESWELSLVELEAFIALMYIRGAMGHRAIELDELWSEKWGPPVFRETMSRQRFRDILRFLRFDLRSNRRDRLQSDKFALASEIWNRFIENCIACYVPGPYLTADEQLFPSKTRCPFIQYMANKPDKFGIKYWLLVDADSKYVCNGFPYVGKDEQRPTNVSASEHVVMKLSEPFLKKGRNITADNFFTSVSLAENLKKANTSLVGTLNKARKEVPPAVKNFRSNLYDTKLLKNGSMTMTVYQGKVAKHVCVLSTLHPTVEIPETDKKVPESIQFYNHTKHGVDVADLMARKYSTRTGTRRWPIHVFENVLDLCTINSSILYRQTTKTKISRRQFILRLADQLRSAYAQSRPQSSGSMQGLAMTQRKQCQIKDCRNKTSYRCSICQKIVCGKHSVEGARTCVTCVQ